MLFSIWETRVQDFQAFADATGYNPGNGMVSLGRDGWKQRGDNWRHPGFTQGSTHPAVDVNWGTANAFCAWLTNREQTPPPVRALLARLLQKDPAARPPSPAALKREIEDCLANLLPVNAATHTQVLETRPPFVIKLPLENPAQEASGTTSAHPETRARTTLASGAENARVYDADTAPGSLAVNTFSHLLYELLGGRPDAVGSGRRTVPLPGLGETGNQVLRRGLNTDPAQMPFATESAFVAALAAALDLGLPEAETLREAPRPSGASCGERGPLVIPTAFLQTVAPPGTRLRLGPRPAGAGVQLSGPTGGRGGRGSRRTCRPSWTGNPGPWWPAPA